MKQKIIEMLESRGFYHDLAKMTANDLLILFEEQLSKRDAIVKKQDELIKMISPRGAEFWGDTSDKYLKLIKDIASLKSRLSEAGEEKKIDQNCANCKYNNLKSYLEPCNTCKMSFTNWQPR